MVPRGMGPGTAPGGPTVGITAEMAVSGYPTVGITAELVRDTRIRKNHGEVRKLEKMVEKWSKSVKISEKCENH